MCGRTGDRSAHERSVSRLAGWLAAVVFLLGCLAGVVSTCAVAMGWRVL